MWKNKKGAEKIFSLYWFAILILVAGGIFAMVYVFYGAPYDVREIEGEILVDRVADCLSYGGRINAGVLQGGTFNSEFEFLNECHLVLKESREEQYYIEVDFYGLGDLENSVYEIKEGRNEWLSSCEIQEGKEYDKLHKCVGGSFYSLDESGNQYLIKILIVVGKSEQNVKK